jgi:diaminopimelate decarboxylase
MQLRLAPGVDPITHDKISTGKTDTKFGFNIADGSAERALVRCLEVGLPVVGFHCHVGSQLLDPDAQRLGGEALALFAVAMRDRHGFETTYLNLGGGLGVKYTEADEPMGVEQYCDLVVKALLQVLEGTGLRPRLGQEPGRSIVAGSGVTIYRVGVVKTVPSPSRGSRTYVGVDGGLSENPRPALYGSRYQVERIGGGAPTYQVTVSGKHCETDMLFEDVLLPEATKPGDLLQVLCTGAYNSSMASNYNRYPRPATVLIRENGAFALVQRRESWDEMLARETVPEDLVRR